MDSNKLITYTTSNNKVTVATRLFGGVIMVFDFRQLILVLTLTCMALGFLAVLVINNNNKHEQMIADTNSTIAQIMSHLDSAYILMDSLTTELNKKGDVVYQDEKGFRHLHVIKDNYVVKNTGFKYAEVVDQAIYTAGVLGVSDATWKKLFREFWREAKKYKEDKLYDYLKSIKKGAHYGETKYGIPRWISYAQGLYESNAGESRMARELNNHNGIKCGIKAHSDQKVTNHCANFHDDDAKDMFVRFSSVYECYKYKADVVLQRSWYKDCYEHNYPVNSDKAIDHWAKYLQTNKNGKNTPRYATSSNYERKIATLAKAIKKKYPNL